MTTPGEFLRMLEGLVIPGGCDDCDAEQVVERVDDGLTRITVRHDPGCPVLARYQGGGES